MGNRVLHNVMIHLTTRVMAQIIPVDLKPAMVIHVHELVYKGLLHVGFAEELACTQNYRAWVRSEPTSARQVTGCTEDV